MKRSAVYVSFAPEKAFRLLEILRRDGFSVATADTPLRASKNMPEGFCGLLILGPDFANADGLKFVEQFRRSPAARQAGVIVLLDKIDACAPQPPARPSKNQGGGQPLRLLFLESGADECLGLDQDARECLVRAKAVLRRVLPDAGRDILRHGGIELNLSSYTLEVCRRRVALTVKEFDLLFVFMSNPNKVLSRPYLIERVWGYNYFGSPRTVDVHVRRVRSKLGSCGRFIATVPCVGYKLVGEESGNA